MIKDINLCGIGNGLVDLQFEVTHEELNDLDVKLGQMILVEVDWQKKLLAKFKKHKRHICSGGSAANTIIAFSQFGGKAAYKTALGNDELGKYYLNEFNELGIELNAPLLSDYPTGTCFVLITPDSERTMLTALGASSSFSRANINEEIIERSEWLYTEGYKFTQENSTDAIFHAIELAKIYDTKIALTFSDNFIIEYFRDNLTKAAEKSDLIFCNETEAKTFAQTDDVGEAFDFLCGICPNIAVTMGDKGSKVKFESEILDIPAYKAKPVDTTGAGDMFAGGFFYGIICENSLEKAGHLGSYAASKIVSQYGARLKYNPVKLKNELFSKLK